MLYNYQLIKNFKFLFNLYVQKYRNKLVISFVLAIIFLIISAAYPLFTKFIIDKIILKSNFEFIFDILWIIGVLWISTSLINFIYNYFLIVLDQNVNFELKKDFFYHLLKLPFVHFYKKKSGELLYRLLDESNIIGTTLALLPITIILNSFIILLAGLIVFLLNWKIGVFVISLFIINFVFYLIFKKKVKKNEILSREKSESIQSYCLERLNNIQIIKSLSLERSEGTLFKNNLKDLLKISISKFSFLKFIDVVVMAIVNLWFLGILLFGTIEISNSNLTIGGLVALINYAMFMFQPFQHLINEIFQLEEISVNMSRFMEVYNLNEEKNENKKSLEKELFLGKVEFNNISFGYLKNKLILENVNFKIEPNSKIAIIGKSGSGKTTLCNLLLLFYKPLYGEIYLDNIDVNNYSLGFLRKNVGYIIQNQYIYPGSILDNLTLAKPGCNMNEIIEASKYSFAYDFIKNLPDGFNTIIGENGVKLSSGESQRIAIARVILQNPKIIIWDEATSNIDIKTEKLILNEFMQFAKNKTILFISHKPTFIKNADKILLLENKKLNEINILNDELLEEHYDR